MPEDQPPQQEETTDVLRRPDEAQLPGLTLRVIEGPEAGREVSVEAQSVRIGKGADCELRLTDRSVSRHHAIVVLTERGYVIEDLESTNGTQVDGVEVKSAVLRPACRIRVGETILQFLPEQRELDPSPDQEDRLLDLSGSSLAMRRLFGLVRQVAPTEATVVIRGETGTGKELVARAIHALSRRRADRFVVFDCGNVETTLLGSELFGHQKGAFTGAQANHRGAFQQAHEGTLFLDEIGEVPLETQSRLLGVLQRREVKPLGAERAQSVDVRVIAATHRNLEQMVQAGTFRQDLYFRLAVMTLHVPPLRQRADDIAALAGQFATEFRRAANPGAMFAPETIEHLRQHGWPGNVRELKNVVERACILAGNGPVLITHLAFSPSGEAARPSTPASPEGGNRLKDLERAAIMQVLERSGGNKSRAARELGIALSTLKRKLNEFEP